MLLLRNSFYKRYISWQLICTIKHQPFNFYGITPYFSGKLGVGFRNDEGKEIETSTSINVVSFVTTFPSEMYRYKIPSVAVMQENTKWTEYGFGIGLEYVIKKLQNQSRIYFGQIEATMSSIRFNI